MEYKFNIQLLKLHLSAIFKRQSKWLITTGSRELIYTSIDPATITHNVFEVKDFMHKVTIVNSELWDCFKLLIPMIDKPGICVELKSLLFVINKCSTKYVDKNQIEDHSVLKLYDEGIFQFYGAITIPDEEFGYTLYRLDTEEKMNCFGMISEYILSVYMEYFKTSQEPESAQTHVVTLDDINDIGGIDLYKLSECSVPIVDGITNVSLTEYNKKTGSEGFLQVITWLEDSLLRFKTRFSNELITVETIQPSVHFFVKRNS